MNSLAVIFAGSILFGIPSLQTITVSMEPHFSMRDEASYFVSTYYDNGVEYIHEESLESICEYVGEIYAIDPIILQSIAYVESSYRVDPNGKGLCQIVPAHNKERISRLEIKDISEPYSNVRCCADLMSDLLEGTDGDMIFALMSYNYGYNKAKKLYPNYISSYPDKVLKQYEIIKGESYYEH